MERKQYTYHGYKVLVEFHTDKYPDLSFLGEYTDRPAWDCPLVIDREKNGDMERGEYQYFVPGYDIVDGQKWYHEHGYSKHESYTLPRKHAREDYKRMEQYNRGDWHMMGIVVKIKLPKCECCGEAPIVEESLWGIESDSEDKYIKDTIRELIKEGIAKAVKA